MVSHDSALFAGVSSSCALVYCKAIRLDTKRDMNAPLSPGIAAKIIVGNMLELDWFSPSMLITIESMRATGEISR